MISRFLSHNTILLRFVNIWQYADLLPFFNCKSKLAKSFLLDEKVDKVLSLLISHLHIHLMDNEQGCWQCNVALYRQLLDRF